MSAKELEPLFSDLDTLLQEGEYEEAVSCCDKILKLAPGDNDAFSCRCLSLIHLSAFQDAIDAIEAANLAKQFSFEKAYCLYRLKNYRDSLAALNATSDSKSIKALQLEAQLLYALEDYDGCVKVYENLLSEHKVDSPELRTNLCAALCQCNAAKGVRFVNENKKALNATFEFAYNAACASIATGDLSVAEELLELSKRICRESLKDCTAEEIEEELVPILVQLGYVNQLCGQIDSALEMYTSALRSNTTNVAAIAVASNNIVSIKKEHDLFDSEKKLKRAMGDKVQDKLTKVQKKAIAFNYCLLLLCMNKIDQCREQAELLKEQYPESAVPSLLLAALLLKAKKTSTCEASLRDAIGQLKNEEQIRAQLSLSQLYLSQHETEKATEVLLSLTSLRYRPALLSILVSLYEKQANVSAAVALLDQAEAALGEEADLILRKSILRASAGFKLKHGLYRDAAEVYRRLVKLDRGDIDSMSRLAMCCAEFDPVEAESYVARMPVPKGETLLDGEALESAAMPTLHRSKDKELNTQESSVPVERKNKEKKKRKRKIRYPKNYDPALNTLPDPERWLPKMERSYYKRRGKKNMISRGPQGSTSGATQDLERSLDASEKGNTKTTQNPPVDGNRTKAVPNQKQGKLPRGKRRGKK